MDIYCLRCTRKTKSLNIEPVITKNKRHLIKAVCNVCKSKRSEFVSKGEIDGSGFLSSLFSRILTLDKII